MGATMKWRLLLLLSLLLLAAPLGCDKEDDGGGPGITDPNNSTLDPDAGDAGVDEPDVDEDADASAMDTDPNPGSDAGDGGGQTGEPDADASDDGGFRPIDTSRPDPDAGPGVTGTCEEIENLGTLAFGSHTIEYGFDGQGFNPDNDNIRTLCRDLSAESKPEKIYQFQVPEASTLEINGSSSLVFEIRTDPCGEESSVEACNPNGRITGFRAYSGSNYYLISEFEGEVSPSPEITFELEVSPTFGTGCSLGHTVCLDTSSVNICKQQGGSLEQETCPTSCTADSCVGDRCDNPITLTGGAATMAGELAGFSSTIDGYQSCTADDGSQIRASGSEVIFLAEQLSAGQTITVDASNDLLSNTILIQRDTCGATLACEATQLGGSETLSYQVPQAGDYYIIVETSAAAEGTADYQVSVN